MGVPRDILSRLLPQPPTESLKRPSSSPCSVIDGLEQADAQLLKLWASRAVYSIGNFIRFFNGI